MRIALHDIPIANDIIVVTPDGTGNPQQWTYPGLGATDDIGFVRTLLDHIEPGAELGGLGLEFLGRELLDQGLELGNFGDPLEVPLDLARIGIA